LGRAKSLLLKEILAFFRESLELHSLGRAQNLPRELLAFPKESSKLHSLRRIQNLFRELLAFLGKS
jgi:hypothetical protein